MVPVGLWHHPVYYIWCVTTEHITVNQRIIIKWIFDPFLRMTLSFATAFKYKEQHHNLSIWIQHILQVHYQNTCSISLFAKAAYVLYFLQKTKTIILTIQDRFISFIPIDLLQTLLHIPSQYTLYTFALKQLRSINAADKMNWVRYPVFSCRKRSY